MWRAEVHLGNFPDIFAEEQGEKFSNLLDLMDSKSGIYTYSAPLRVLSLHWDLGELCPAPLDQVTTQARQVVEGAGFADPCEVIDVRVYDRERPSRTSEMYRYADMATLAGVSRQRIAQLAASDESFPKPFARLPNGTPLFLPSEAVEYVGRKFRA
jgi:hypothetical protein